MHLRIPVTYYYDVQVCDVEDCTGVCVKPESDRRVRQCVKKLTVEQIRQRGALVSTEVGSAKVVYSSLPLEAPCTD
ncbi:MAG: hypothetical protein IT440_09005 [Phycisphaeraceae bacterium]|nr:hypothetical protein [Phycisphaeraceae bacterium]